MLAALPASFGGLLAILCEVTSMLAMLAAGLVLGRGAVLTAAVLATLMAGFRRTRTIICEVARIFRMILSHLLSS
jgi:hypothetical protein